jgi:hypothetical protein
LNHILLKQKNTMKTLISLMILMTGLLAALPYGNQVQALNPGNQTSFAVDNPNTAPEALDQREGGVATANSITGNPSAKAGELVEPVEGGNFFSDNWGALLMGLPGFVELVARLTPTEKDNSIVNFLLALCNAIIPNFKKGGGSFRLLSK